MSMSKSALLIQSAMADWRAGRISDEEIAAIIQAALGVLKENVIAAEAASIEILNKINSRENKPRLVLVSTQPLN